MSRLKIEGRGIVVILRMTVVLTLLWLTGVSGAAQAQDGFVPASNIGRENLPALPMLYTAYGFVWIVLLGYVFLLWRRLSRVEKELHDVAARIKADAAKR